MEGQEELETINMLIMFLPFIENSSHLHKADLRAAHVLNSYEQCNVKVKENKKS